MRRSRSLVLLVLPLVASALVGPPGCGRGGTGGPPKGAADSPTPRQEPTGALAPSDGPPPAPATEAGADDEREGEAVVGGGEGSKAQAESARGAPASASAAMRRHAEANVTVVAVQARGIDEDVARQRVEEQLVPLAACHAKELRRNPSLEGTADAVLSLEDGRTTGVRVTGLGDAALERCLEGVLGALALDGASSERVSVRVRLKLSRE